MTQSNYSIVISCNIKEREKISGKLPIFISEEGRKSEKTRKKVRFGVNERNERRQGIWFIYITACIPSPPPTTAGSLLL